MVKKIRECVSAKKDENFKIIARSDAKSVEGMDKMIDRCKAYIDAGAEIIFPEALQDCFAKATLSFGFAMVFLRFCYGFP